MHRTHTSESHARRARQPRARLLSALLAGSLVCGSCWAFDRDKSDVVTLQNGDHLSGDIVSLQYGILTVKTNNMSTLDIEWPAVRSIASKFSFAVERTGGVNYYGPIATTPDGSTLVVGDGASVTRIPLAEVERISQFSPTFWDRINGNLAVGFSYTKSSEISVGSVNFDSNYRSTAVSASLNFSSNTTRSPEGGETDRDVLTSSVLFLRQSRNFWGLVGSLERDQALGIDARLLGGAGLGRRFLQRSFSEVTGIAGVVGTQEWIKGESQARGSVEGLLGGNWRIFRFIEPKTTLDVILAVYPSFTETDRYRATSNLTFTHKLTGDLTLGLTGYWSYDSRPPGEAAEKSDYGLTFNVGYSFGR